MKKQNKILLFVFLLATFFMLNVCYAETYENFTYKVEDGKVIITGYNNTYSEKLVIPSKINNMNVIAIDNGAFSNCTNIIEVDLGNVETVGFEAFEYCTNLTTVTIPKTLTKGTIDSVFKGCINLKNVIFEEGVTVIPSNLFYKSHIESIVIPDSVKTIEYGAFEECEQLTSVDLGRVECISFEAFKNCTSLEEITIPNTLTKSGIDAVFKGCTKLTKVTLEEGLTIIPSNLLAYTNIESIVIPDSVKAIDHSAFEGCTKLTSVDLGSVESISFEAFKDCTSLEEITIPKTLKKGSVDAVFKGCTNLTNITLEEGLTIIPSNLLAYTNIQSIVIPKTVTEIGQYAFQECPNLTEVKILGDVTKLGFFTLYPDKDTIFNDGNENLKVYCYEGTKVAQYVKQTGIDYSFIPKIDIANAESTEVSDYMYTGSAIKPSVSLTYNGETLLNNIDYTVSYKNNVKVGTATITISGKLGYKGTKTITFKINKRSMDTLTYSKVSNYSYTGKAIIPNVTVKNGKITLKNKTDYTISYKNNKNAGTATITITGKGNYTGTKKITFKINPLSITKYTFSKMKNYTYTGSAIKQSISVKKGKTALKNGTDYTVSYKNNKNAGTATVTITGKGNYTGTKTFTFKISKRSISKLSFSKVKSYTYTGKAIKPGVTVKYGKKALVKDTDYTVSYKSNTKVGTATITVTGKGNYSGTKKITFKINRRSISSASISGLKSKTYTGSKQTQSLKLTYNGITLKYKTDFTVSYKNNIKAGTATVTITGKGNFTGSVKKTFKINKRSVNDLKISAVTSASYTGKAIKPSVTVKYGSKKLKKDTDYTLSYKNNTSVGTATITVTGKGNFTGTKKLTFKINPKAVKISSATLKDNVVTLKWNKVSGVAGYQVYVSKNGAAYTLAATVKKNSTITYKYTLKNSGEYSFKVRVYNDSYYGSYSNVKSVKYTATNEIQVRPDGTKVYGEGTYIVGKDIDVGIYKISCINDRGFWIGKYETSNKNEIAVASGKYYDGYVEIKSTDYAIEFENGTLEKVDLAKMPSNIKTTLTSGIYIVGKDLEPGIYKMTTTEDLDVCYVARLNSFDLSYESYITTVDAKTGYVEIKSTDLAIEVYGKIEKVTVDDLEVNISEDVQDGIHIVDKDIAPGIYKFEIKSGEDYGFISRLSSVDGEYESILAIETATDKNVKYSGYIEILNSDFAVNLLGVKLTKIKDVPVNMKDEFYVNGTYIVGRDIAPGIYKIDTDECCFIKMLSDLTFSDESWLSTYLVDDNGYIEIRETDYAIQVSDGNYDSEIATKFIKVKDEVNIQTKVSDGTYIVGRDIAPGIYKVTTTGDYSNVYRLSSVRGDYGDIIASDWITNGYVEIKETDFAVEIKDGILEKIDLNTTEKNYKDELTDGIYLVGIDIAPGRYKIDSLNEEGGGYVYRLNTIDMSQDNRIDYGCSDYDEYIDILETDVAVEIDGARLIKLN